MFATSASLFDVEQHPANHATSGSAYDFGFDNPQFSDGVLYILEERSAPFNEAQSAEAQQAAAPRLLRKLHVNSLTLAANSEVFRWNLP